MAISNHKDKILEQLKENIPELKDNENAKIKFWQVDSKCDNGITTETYNAGACIGGQKHKYLFNAITFKIVNDILTYITEIYRYKDDNPYLIYKKSLSDIKFNALNTVSDTLDSIITDDIQRSRSLIRIFSFLESVKLAKRWSVENHKKMYIEIEEEQSVSILRHYITAHINVENVLLCESITVTKPELEFLLDCLKPLKIKTFRKITNVKSEKIFY